MKKIVARMSYMASGALLLIAALTEATTTVPSTGMFLSSLVAFAIGLVWEKL